MKQYRATQKQETKMFDNPKLYNQSVRQPSYQNEELNQALRTINRMRVYGRIPSLYEGKISPHTTSILIEWEIDKRIEENLFTVRGPVLTCAVKSLQDAIDNHHSTEEDLYKLMKRVDDVLFDDSVVLAPGDVMGCGVLHTS